MQVLKLRLLFHELALQ